LGEEKISNDKRWFSKAHGGPSTVFRDFEQNLAKIDGARVALWRRRKD
jgi:hypothetical protein